MSSILQGRLLKRNLKWKLRRVISLDYKQSQIRFLGIFAMYYSLIRIYSGGMVLQVQPGMFSPFKMQLTNLLRINI